MQRKNHTPSQLPMFAALMKKELEPAAKGRQRKHGDTAPGRKKNTSRHVAGSVSGESSRLAATEFGIGARTVDRATTVVDNGCKQLQEAVKSGRVNVTLAEKVTKAFSGQKQVEVVAVAMA